MAKSLNRNLHKAKKEKNDEFYTQLSDIENELFHYREHFKDKTILCNCDDPRVSNFFHYFYMNFKFFGLKKLIATCYKSQEWNLFSEGDCEKAVYIVYEGPSKDNESNPMPQDEDIRVMNLEGDGDFRSAECRAFLEAADIVVTNPPFSLFRDFVALMMKYKKQFIIIGNTNALTYKEIFPLIKDKKMWLGYGFKEGNAYFHVPDDLAKSYSDNVYDSKTKLVKFRNCCWFTNIKTADKKKAVELCKTYSPTEYPKFDNFDAINVNKVADIPIDYFGVMGVPITFLDKWNPNNNDKNGMFVTTDDFEIVEFRRGVDGRDMAYGIESLRQNPFILENTVQSTSIGGLIKNDEGKINGKPTYARILIKRKI